MMFLRVFGVGFAAFAGANDDQIPAHAALQPVESADQLVNPLPRHQAADEADDVGEHVGIREPAAALAGFGNGMGRLLRRYELYARWKP